MHQHTATLRSVSAPLNIRVVAVDAERTFAESARVLEQAHVDVAVSTPHMIAAAIRHPQTLFLSQLDMCIVDEVDVIAAERSGFVDAVKRIVDAAPRDVQYVLLAATVDGAAQTAFSRLFGAVERIRSSLLHTLSPRLRIRFIPVGAADKLERLMQIVDAERRAIIVFANSIPSANAVRHRLNASGYADEVAAVHGDVPMPVRSQMFDDFLRGSRRILVTTDIASRGLDFTSVPAPSVIQFDCAQRLDDFIHRTGRTARNGEDGRSTVLVSTYDRPLIQTVRDAIKHNRPLIGAVSATSLSVAHSSVMNSKFVRRRALTSLLTRLDAAVPHRRRLDGAVKCRRRFDRYKSAEQVVVEAIVNGGAADKRREKRSHIGNTIRGKTARLYYSSVVQQPNAPRHRQPQALPPKKRRVGSNPVPLSARRSSVSV